MENNVMLESKKKLATALIIAAMAATASTGAYAEIPPAAQAALDSVSGFADAVIGWMWGVATT
ncbi:major coat protein, partial [Streptomyces sp. P17]|uniref:major coat protein n=1 Tax=Streptomyces sp. P17 TaxID=3074716 RepID=UPI0028F450E5